MPKRIGFTLTAKMVVAVGFVDEYWKEFLEAPTLVEIGERLGVKKETAHYYTSLLTREGYLEEGKRRGKSSRGGWRLTGKGAELLVGVIETAVVGRGKKQ